MRDDIHKRAPISAPLKRVLGLAVRAADRKNPERIRDVAVGALEKELPTLMRVNPFVSREPTLFGDVDFGVPQHHRTRFEEDVAHHLSVNGNAAIGDAIENATRAYIKTACNETEAMMIAAGERLSEINEVLSAFSRACEAAAPIVIEALARSSRPEVADHRVTLSEALPIKLRPGARR